MGTELRFEAGVSILLATTTSTPLLSTLHSAQKSSWSPSIYLLPPISEPWHSLLYSRQRRSSKQQVIPGLLFFLHHFLAQILCQRSCEHSVTPFFNPNIVLWKLSNIQTVEKMVQWSIPPVGTHHLDSTIKIFLYLFPSLQTFIRLPDPSDLSMCFTVRDRHYYIMPVLLSTYKVRTVANSYWAVPLPDTVGIGIEHLSSISWSDSQRNPMRRVQLPPSFPSWPKLNTKNKGSSKQFLGLAMGHARCQGLFMHCRT